MYSGVLRNPDREVRIRALRLVLVLVNVAAGLGVYVTAQIGRPRYFGMGVVFAVTVVFLDGLVFASPEKLRRRDWERVVAVVRDRRTIVVSLCLAALALLFAGRGLVYFGAISAFFTLLVARVLTTDYSSTSWRFEIGVLVAGTAFLLASQSLTVAYYARTFDTIYHTTLARRIATFGSIESVSSTRYDDLALFHVQASVGIRATALDPRVYAGVFFAALYALALVALFALFRTVSGSVRVGLLGSVLVAVNPWFVIWGTDVHAQGLNFVFMVGFLLILCKWRPDYRLTALGAVVAVALVTTHHLSTAMTATLVSVPLVVVFAWMSVSNSRIVLRSVLGRYLTLVGLVVYYWNETGIVAGVNAWISDVNPQASAGVPTKQFVVESYGNPGELLAATVPFLLNNAHYVVFLLFSGYALWVLLRGRQTTTDRSLFVAFVFLFAVLLYVPNPAWIPLRGIAVLNRWGVMTLPFLLLPAVGLSRLATDYRGTVGSVVVAALVFSLVFTSVGGGFSDPSLADATGNEKGAQRFFSTGDLAAADFTLAHRNDSAVYGPTTFPGLLQCTSWTGSGPDYPRGFDWTPVTEGRLDVPPGLSVVPERAFREGLIKVDISGTRGYDEDTTIWTAVSDETVDWNRGRHSIVYDNGETVVAHEPDDGPSGPSGDTCK